MKTIRISGIIATWEGDNEENVTPKTLANSLAEANGEDVLILINSPGGSVFAGLEMFNMIKNYSGHTETRPVSLAASMGSILSLAGDKKTAENTAMYFVHNAQGGASGDYRDMLKASQWLKDVSSLLADIYVENTSLNLKQVQDYMDGDTQFFGNSLAPLGFEIVESGADVSESTARVQAVTRLKECRAKLSDEEIFNDLEKVAASIAEKKPKAQIKNIKTPDVSGINKTKEITSMTKEELKAQFPDVYNAIIQEGVNQNQDLVTAHLTMGKAGNCMDLAVKNITEKKEINNTVSAEYMAEGMKKRDVSNRLEDEPENLGTGSDDLEDDTEAQAKYNEALAKKMGAK